MVACLPRFACVQDELAEQKSEPIPESMKAVGDVSVLRRAVQKVAGS